MPIGLGSTNTSCFEYLAFILLEGLIVAGVLDPIGVFSSSDVLTLTAGSGNMNSFCSLVVSGGDFLIFF